VVRGRVLDVHGAPLVGVRVSVVTHPLYGFTLTRRPHGEYVTVAVTVTVTVTSVCLSVFLSIYLSVFSVYLSLSVNGTTDLFNGFRVT